MATLTAYYAINMMSTVFVDGAPTNFNSGNQVTLNSSSLTAKLFGNFTWDTNTKPNPTLGGNINYMVVSSSTKGDLYKIVFDPANSDATTFQTLVTNDIPLDADKWVFGGNDVITGSAESDFLGGCGGNDTIKGGGGDDTISGGSSGATTAVFDATFAASTIIKNSDGTYTISNAVDGTDTLINVTYAKFADKTVTIADVAPTIYKWSTLTNGQQLTFDPSKDKLVFDDASISAANLSFSFTGTTSVTIAYGGTTVTIAASVKSLTTSNVTFANGSLLVVGDNAVAATADDNANTLDGSAQGDLLIGLGGNDVINGGTGDDVILIGYPMVAVGNDTVDGGAGTDTLIYPGSNTLTPAITVDMAGHTVSSSQGTLTIKSIEKVRGTAGNDSFIGGASEHKIDSLGNITNEIFRGNGGNDTISGVVAADSKWGNDITYRIGADYSNNTSAQAINADLHAGTVSDGLGGTDKLSFVSMVFGGAGNDVIAGGSLTRGHNGMFWEMFRGNAGDDTLDGANKWSDGDDASSDRADYSNNTSAQAISVNLVTGKVADGLGGTDILIDIDQVWGGAGNDVFLGGAGNETFDGGAGNDTIDGGGGFNRVSYKQSTNGVIVNLGGSALNVDTRMYPVTGVGGIVTVEAGSANDGMGGTDTLRNITNINGSDFSDYLRGSDIVGQRSFLGGLGGDNILVGGAGVGIADYNGLPLYFGINVFVVSLVADANGKVSVNNGFGGVDTLINIKGLAGTNGADSLTGGAGDEFFRGNGGADTIDGGAGNDWVIYNNSANGVDVNLATGLAVDGWNGANGLLALGGTDRLVNIENVEGSNYADKLTGNDGDNVFKGLSGDDTIDGGLGKDTLILQGAEADYVVTRLDAGSYTVQDKVSGRDGTDTIRNIEFLTFADKTITTNKAPSVTSANAGSIAENVPASTPAYTVVGFDPDPNTKLLYSIIGGADAGLFNIDGSTGVVTFKASPNYEAAADADKNNVYDINVRVSDGDLFADKAVAISVTNVNEAPSVTSANAVSIAENVSTSTSVYTVAGTDPDANTKLVYSIMGGADAGLFNIDSSTGAVTFKASPNYEAAADSDKNNVYEITVRASDGALSADKAVKITVTDVFEVKKAASDFNGDGKSDILLDNVKEGSFFVWQMDGLKFASSDSYGYVGWGAGPAWQAKGSGDFNFDGKSDILLQNSLDGSCFVWQMDGLKVANSNSYGYVGWTPGKEWQVKGTGDFNADGKSDILLQNSVDGSCYVWEMNGLSLLTNGYVGWTPGKEWQVKGTGDFNADGKSDILLQNSVDGSCYVWGMDGLNLKPDGYGYIGWTPGKEWQVKGTGDFNADGKSDILLQNSTNGDCYVWETNGPNAALVGYGYVGWSPGKEWVVKATGDYNGDGKSDILLQNSVYGSCYVWELDGLNPLSSGSYGYVGWTPGTDWQATA